MTVQRIGGFLLLFIFVVVSLIDTYMIVMELGNERVLTQIFTQIIILGVIIIIWIVKQIIVTYEDNQRARHLVDKDAEIEQLKVDIEHYKEENEGFSRALHRVKISFAAMERSVRGIVQREGYDVDFNTEIGSEYGDILDEIQKLSGSFKEDLKRARVGAKKEIPLTNKFAIDNVLEYMLEKAEESNIEFDVKIKKPIHIMIDKVINQEDLAGLIGDHLENAMIAIRHREGVNHRILLVFGLIEDHYQIWIYDTGIPFEIDTLINLGKERITTHKQDGGSGIGFMTSFEILEKTKASLIIEEKKLSECDYSKIIKIRFDGKKEYRINSYRAEEIKEKLVDDRIIVDILL